MTSDDEHPSPDPGGAQTPSDREQDLRATTDAIRADVDRLTDIETAKQDLDPEDPRIDELSDVAVSVADRIAREARAERQLGRELG
jgi:hypothetical protein